jgi:DNA-binding CsgD family transcriptional regulator
VLDVLQLTSGSISIRALAESGVMFSIIAEDGTLLALSPAAARNRARVGQPGLEAVVGHKLDQMYGPEIVAERMAIMRRCLSTGKPLTYRSVMWGEQYVTYVHKLPPQESITGLAVIAIHQRVEGDVVPELYQGIEFFEAEHNEYGTLAALSPREVEVLSMLGQGQDTQEIAKTLCRSTETIISHKKSLYAKLRCDSHISAALLARRAGLTQRDVERFSRSGAQASARRRHNAASTPM